MLPMRKIVVSDTSCFIILDKINELDLLYKLYGNIITTPQIAEEFGKELPFWIEIKEVSDKQKMKLLETNLDAGEASAIALAMEYKNSLLILDDQKARKLALQLELNYTGTLGIIIAAKKKQIIPSIKPFIEKIKQTNFHISAELELQALKEAGE
jgi:predicted nucleic acid-binding protein